MATSSITAWERAALERTAIDLFLLNAREAGHDVDALTVFAGRYHNNRVVFWRGKLERGNL